MSRYERFKNWAFSHTLRLPYKLSIKVHEDVVDFVHGLMIGLLLGAFAGFIIAGLLN